ncbi:UNVERIFIED_CONTAM: RNA polymerase sigma factor (sigma-70 family) [Acetivibrio alkalicellulosi]
MQMENEKLVKRFKEGDQEALAELTEQNIDLIKFVASKFTIHCNYITYDDLFQQGWFGFKRAAETYDPDHEAAAKFSTWAIHWIRQSIQRYLEQKTPKTKEKSIYEEYGEDLTLVDTLEDPEQQRKVYDYAERRELRRDLEQVMDKYLSLQQREILKLRYGWSNEVRFTYTGIGEVLGLKKQNVQQQHNYSLQRLRKTPWGRLKWTEHKGERINKLRYLNPIYRAETLDDWRKNY